MKRTAILVALVLLLAAPAFSIGIGAAYSVDFIGQGLPSNVMLSLYAPEYFPAVLGVGFAVGSNTFNLGLTADWWLYRGHLAGIIDMYAGLGFYADISQNFGLGARIPVGLQIFPLDFLELFIEAAPKFGATLGDPVQFPTIGVQGAFGFRFWF